MKLKFKIIAFALACASLFACSKNNDIVEDNSQLSHGRIVYQKLMKMEVLTEKQLAFTSLSPETKYGVWMAKFEDAIGSTEYSAAQIDKIKEVREHLSIEVFKEGDKREIFFTQFFTPYIKDIEKIFSGIQIYSLFYSIDAADYLRKMSRKENTGKKINGVAEVCFCALHSRFTCIQAGWPPIAGSCIKTSSPCISSEKGCGALFDQECDGNSCPQDRD